MRPTWRNFNGAAQTFAGTLTDFTGPRGRGLRDHRRRRQLRHASPTARPRSAPTATRVSVSNPASRPAVHWDASAVECILPDMQGQQKQWLLHVGRSFTDVPTSERVLSLHRDPAAPRRDRRLLPDRSTARPSDHARPDGGVRPRGRRKERDTYRPPAPPRCSTTSPRQPFCRWIEELARRGGRERMRRRQLLPDQRGHARADGGLRAAHAGPRARLRRPARRRSSTTFPRPARSAAGSRS